MEATLPSAAGRVVAIWRYPVKSMMGEELNAVDVAPLGVAGDRAFALIDAATSKVASAKNPRRWPNLFDFRAAYTEPTVEARPLPPVWITFPDGEVMTSETEDLDAKLSAAVGNRVRLAKSVLQGAVAEGYWPDHDWLPQRDETFEFSLPVGTYFDGATIHLITTATLDRLRSLDPDSRFEPRRFRPNFVIESPTDSTGFVEDTWVGRTLSLGVVELRIDRPCPRCIMTTLPQGDLPKDPGVLRTAVHQNEGNVGVYASVIRGGRVRRGDPVRLE
jgi:uncharacterized protein YcbX